MPLATTNNGSLGLDIASVSFDILAQAQSLICAPGVANGLTRHSDSVAKHIT